jgi:hypothetical protein
LNTLYSYQGSSRKNRINKALDCQYFLPDERTTGDFLQFVYKHAQILKFYDINGNENETWKSFFEGDDSFLLAEIAGIDIESIEKEKIKILNLFEGYDELLAKINQFEHFFIFCLDLLKQLNTWYKRASETNKGVHITSIENELYTAIISEGTTILSKLIAYDMAKTSCDLPIYMQNDYSSFLSIWKIEDTEPISIYHFGDNELEQISHALKEVILLYPPIISLFRSLNFKAPDLFKKTFYENENHSPHNGLIFAFLELYAVLKTDLNKLTYKHLDFFYAKVLGQKPKNGNPDSLFVYAILNPDYQEVFLDQDTILHAGQNAAGFPEKYKIDQGIQVTSASINKLITLYVSRNPLVDVYSQFRLVSGIYGKEINDTTDFEAFASFGEEQLFLGEEEKTMSDIKIGFAISSPTLRLCGGIRSITLSFYFSPESIDKLTFLLLDIAEKRHIKPEEVFHEVFAHAFTISLTAEDGWISPNSYRVITPSDWTKDPITLTFDLDESIPAIIPFNEEIHLGNYNSLQPIVRVFMSGGLTTHPYSYLENMHLNEIELGVKVKKLKNITLFNHLGDLDFSNPFPLLGPIPSIGSYFVVGSAELFSKDLDDLKIALEYQPLGLDGGTFISHYEAYQKNIEAKSFTVSLTALSNFEFNPENRVEAQKFSLFNAEPIEGIIENVAFDQIDFSKLQIQPNYNLSEEVTEQYNSEKQTGFLKFTLSNPPMGFGFDLYPKIFVSAITENAKPNSLLSGEKPAKLVPNNPVFPIVSDFKISYSSTSKFQFDERKIYENNPAKGEKIYHLHPYGIENIFSEGKPKRKQIIPSLPEEGYLFIGIENLNLPQQLNLLFHTKRSEQWEIGHNPEVKWQYLSREEWIDFEQDGILNDGTRNLMVTGIISFALPSNLTKNNNILSGENYWLRAVTRQKADLFSKIITIYTNATTATYQYTADSSNHPIQLTANSISEIFIPIEGIMNIIQPLDSFNGTHNESDDIFHTRVAERIRHKNRCLTRWDIEHMLLNRFDDLNQVKCIGYNSHENFISKGEIVIVAIPKVNGEKQFYEPKLNPELIEEIRSFITAHTSPFLKLEIRNPSYEYLRLKAKVIFEGKSTGRFIRELQKDLLQFICPWFYNDNVDASLGGSIKKSALIQFVESRPYVKFVTGLSVIQLQMNDNGLYLLKDTASDIESTDSLLKGGTPWSVLIPSFSNDISILEKPKFYAPEPADLSDFRIGNTLVIASDNPPSTDNLELNDKNEMLNGANQYPVLFTLNF